MRIMAVQVTMRTFSYPQGRKVVDDDWLFSQMWNKGRESSYIDRTSENDCVDADVPEVTILLVKSFGKCYFRCFSMVQLG